MTVTAERLAERLKEVRERIARATGRAGRRAEDVEILPVTKGHPAYGVRRVAEAGFRVVGENRVGEAEEKRRLLGGDAGLRWHMVGRVQGRKAARAAGLFDVIESVDSVRLAERLDRAAAERAPADPAASEGGSTRPPEADRPPAGRELEVLVQVNTSGEASKSGFSPEETVEAVEAICRLPHLRVRGLMTMAPYTREEERLRRTFREARRLFESCASEIEGFEARVLSMGMSNDFEVAVEEGSTRVRLGTVLLGPRG